ncbi:MAG: hypothetical protein KJO07_06230 [Deltaproteobacteria bacterium]|nr:hypothetical protein [Deltaproteobacteria bacterium]
MSPWDRRRVIQTLLGAAALPLAGSCSGAARRRTRSATEPEILEPLVRRAADELIATYPQASVLMRTIDAARAERSADEHSLDRGAEKWLRLRAKNGSRWREVWTSRVTDVGIAEAVADLRRLLGPGRRTTPRSRDSDHGRELEPVLTTMADQALDGPVEALFTALSQLPSSRLIRRTARLESIDRHDLFIDSNVERKQRFVNHRLTASVVASTGTAPAEATTAVGAGSLEGLAIPRKQLEETESWALALLTARQAPRGPSSLVLSSPVSALLFGACLAPCLDGSTWTGNSAFADDANRDLRSPLLTITDDPRGREYGSLHFDDEGLIAESTTLVDAGKVTAALGRGRSSRARRYRQPGGQWRGHPTRMVVGPGADSLTALMQRVGSGILVEGPIAASIDRRTLDFSVRASRGLGIDKGTLSGRLYGSLQVRGNLLELLRAVVALSAEGATLPLGLSTELPMPFSVQAPAVATSGFVEPG